MLLLEKPVFLLYILQSTNLSSILWPKCNIFAAFWKITQGFFFFFFNVNFPPLTRADKSKLLTPSAKSPLCSQKPFRHLGKHYRWWMCHVICEDWISNICVSPKCYGALEMLVPSVFLSCRSRRYRDSVALSKTNKTSLCRALNGTNEYPLFLGGRVFHRRSLNKFEAQVFYSAMVLSSVWLGQHTGGPLPRCFLYLGP